MNVLILSSMYPNSKVYLSGVFVHQLVKALKQNKIELTVISPIPYVPQLLKGFRKKWKGYALVPECEDIDGITVYHPKYIALPRGILKEFWSYTYAFFFLKLYRKNFYEKKFDIIHAHGSSPDDYAAYLISQKLNIPYIITVHGETVFYSIKKPRLLKFSSKALINAHHIIAVSELVKKRIQKFIVNKPEIEVIYNGFTPPVIIMEKIERNSRDEVILLFVATLIERKGCRYLLEAFSKIQKSYPETRLIVVGGGNLLNSLKSLSVELSIQDKITFTGQVDNETVLKLMSNCDIFVLPSWDEAFGVVYLEALSYQKAIIACQNEGISEILDDNVHGLFVKARDSSSIYDKLSILISDPDLRKKLGRNGYEKIKELTWEKTAQKTMTIYERVSAQTK